MKHYTFLQEFITAAAALSALPMALGATSLGLGAKSTYNNVRQNSFNNKYLNLMYRELGACATRQKALEIVNRYSTKLTAMYGKMVNKKMSNKLAIMQNFINTNFKIPLTKIITNQQDPNWKVNALTYFRKNSRNINIKNALRTTATATSLAAGGALMSGLGGATAAIIAASTLWINVAVRQLKTFNSTRFLNRMKIELQNCPDDNRQLAQQILEKYCYDISNNIKTIVDKSKKKINFDVQQQLRSRMLTPCLQIIYNNQNRYWKVSLIDYIETQKIQDVIQNICDTISQLLIPRVVRRMYSR